MQYWPVYVSSWCKDNDYPVYTVKEHLQCGEPYLHYNCSFTVCRQIYLYVKTEFLYYSVAAMISVMAVNPKSGHAVKVSCYTVAS